MFCWVAITLSRYSLNENLDFDNFGRHGGLMYMRGDWKARQREGYPAKDIKRIWPQLCSLGENEDCSSSCSFQLHLAIASSHVPPYQQSNRLCWWFVSKISISNLKFFSDGIISIVVRHFSKIKSVQLITVVWLIILQILSVWYTFVS